MMISLFSLFLVFFSGNIIHQIVNVFFLLVKENWTKEIREAPHKILP
ncbi:hypothetical protein HSISS2_1966 [Streptococcus sp. HSISS2]|nr:hypothetical protein HSISS2_1966 [Streptococcus sp. HSISS2]